MSWKDRLENIQFKIVTGDGEEFFPLWKSTSKEKEFNTSKYEFIDKSGSLITRKKPKSNKIPLVFWFQGDDNIDQAQKFENSADDSRLWTITHPFYGVLKGQPLNLKRDDKDFNITQVNVDFWESINGDMPSSEISISDSIIEKVNEINENAISSFSQGVDLKVSDISNIRINSNLISSSFTSDQNNFANFSNIVSESQNSFENIFDDPLSFITLNQKVIDITSSFSNSIYSKINSYKLIFNNLKNSIYSKTDKFYFESQCATIFGAIAKSVLNGSSSDFVTRDDVISVNIDLIDLFNDYLLALDENQVDGYDVNNFWNPNHDLLRSLFDLVFFTSNRLFQISFNAKQERVFELEKDSNLIILTHRFLGLDPDDENINLFKKINNIKNNELFTIPKGRILKYYV